MITLTTPRALGHIHGMRDRGFLFVSANYSVEGINRALGARSVTGAQRSLCQRDRAQTPLEGRPHMMRTSGTEQRPLMTLRISRDSGKTWEQSSIVREGEPVMLMNEPMRYPDCECPRCVGRRTVPARSLAPLKSERGRTL